MGSTPPSVRYTPDGGEELSSAIVEALSTAKGRDITEDECVLYNSIDPDALDRMFRETQDGNIVKVEFTTYEAIVGIWGNGEMRIEVQDLEDDPGHE